MVQSVKCLLCKQGDPNPVFITLIKIKPMLVIPALVGCRGNVEIRWLLGLVGKSAWLNWKLPDLSERPHSIKQGGQFLRLDSWLHMYACTWVSHTYENINIHAHSHWQKKTSYFFLQREYLYSCLCTNPCPMPANRLRVLLRGWKHS